MTEQTASERFAAWWENCNDPVIMTPYSGQSGCHSDGGLVESAMWSDFTGPDPEDVQAFWGSDYDGCSITVDGYDYSLVRAVVRYVAYPLPVDWDGTEDAEFAGEAAWSVDDWDAGIVVATGLQEYGDICRAFSEWFDSHHGGKPWLLREEACPLYDDEHAEWSVSLAVRKP